MPIYDLDDRKVEMAEGVFVAPSAELIGSIKLEKNASVWFNVTMRADNDWIIVGEDSNVQDGTVVHNDPGKPVHIGKGVTIGHMCMIHGCTIEDNSLVGIGSIVLDGAKIGKNSLLGANSLLAEGKEIPEGVLALGSPARVVRELSDQEIKGLEMSAAHYVQNAQRYLGKLRAAG